MRCPDIVGFFRSCSYQRFGALINPKCLQPLALFRWPVHRQQAVARNIGQRMKVDMGGEVGGPRAVERADR
jgi:hypothetical protein